MTPAAVVTDDIDITIGVLVADEHAVRDEDTLGNIRSDFCSGNRSILVVGHGGMQAEIEGELLLRRPAKIEDE